MFPFGFDNSITLIKKNLGYISYTHRVTGFPSIDARPSGAPSTHHQYQLH